MTTHFTALPLYYTNFNSHAHVERDYSGFTTGTNYQDFNSHAHVERDLADSWEYGSAMQISTHTLTWSVTTDQMSRYGSYWDFNSHAHVERDLYFTNQNGR